jgi:hypothetical protein
MTNYLALFDTLSAGPDLVGVYDGQVVQPAFLQRPAAHIWAGKVFFEDRVVNRIGGGWHVSGIVTRTPREQMITYRFGVRDVIRYDPAGDRYLGRLNTSGIWFTLVRVPE